MASNADSTSKDRETMTDPTQTSSGVPFKRGWRFWMIFLSLCCCTLLSALDMGGIGTAAPTIVHQLNGSDFTWVASAYALSSSAFMPLSGNLSQMFGRRIVMISGILSFAAGSTISGSAHSLAVLIAGRTIQGIGAGAMQTASAIIITDLVPLRHRGAYAGITGVIWTTGSAVGPFIAGGLAEKATWRWLFYLNLPLSGIALSVVWAFLRVKSPEGSTREKFMRVDWLGNGLIMASTSLCMIALTFGGVRFPWISTQVLLPLVIGVCGLLASVVYEAKCPKHPVVPVRILSNRTTFSGYVATFLQGMVTLGVGFYLPTWFQAVKVASPTLSGLYFLPLAATISPSAIVQGVIVSKTGLYRPVIFSGWLLSTLGIGLLVSAKIETHLGLIILYQLIIGVGLGLLYAITFPVLAPLPLADNSSAVSFLTFLRQISQAWGIAIGGTLLQISLKDRLPEAIFSSGTNHGGQIAYAIIPQIKSIPEPLREEVQAAFLESLKLVWIGFTVCSSLGFLSLFPMKNYPLKKMVDGRWGIDRDQEPSQAVQSTEKLALDVA